jgi:hypothetical protein
LVELYTVLQSSERDRLTKDTKEGSSTETKERDSVGFLFYFLKVKGIISIAGLGRYKREAWGVQIRFRAGVRVDHATRTSRDREARLDLVLLTQNKRLPNL